MNYFVVMLIDDDDLDTNGYLATGIQKSFTRTLTQLEVWTSLTIWNRFSTIMMLTLMMLQMLMMLMMLMLMIEETEMNSLQCLAGLATERAEKGGGVVKVGV